MRSFLTSAAIVAATAGTALSQRPAMRPPDLRHGTRSTRSFRIRAAPIAMSRTTGRAGRARITASPACMASMSSAAPTAAASAIRACAARPAISPAIPACCMDRQAPRAGIWRQPKWSGGRNRRRRSARRSRIRSAMAAARWRQVAVHVRDDPLVGWGWHPGAGREPAPGSAERDLSRHRGLGGRRGALPVPIDAAHVIFLTILRVHCCCRRRRLARARTRTG